MGIAYTGWGYTQFSLRGSGSCVQFVQMQGPTATLCKSDAIILAKISLLRC